MPNLPELESSNNQQPSQENPSEDIKNVFNLAHQPFSPEFQNIMAVLTAAMEPLLLSFIAELASNVEGKAFGNHVDVTEDQVAALIRFFADAEDKHDVQLFERGKILGNTDPESLQLGYKLTNEAQDFVKKRHPELWKGAHTLIADQLWNSLFGDDEKEEKGNALDSGFPLLPVEQEFTHLVDDTVTHVKRLISNGSKSE